MKYMGSKNRIAKHILPIMLEHRTPEMTWVEPFAGGMNIVDKVDGCRIANDKNKYLIAMWQGLQRGVVYPTEITKDLYDLARDIYMGRETRIEHRFNMTDDIVGWIGWMGSYNGRFFDGGYSGHCVGKTKRDYIGEQIKNTLKQVPNISDVDFISVDYRDIELRGKCLIYCDPPYKNTKQYATSKNFNHKGFWQWCRDKANEGHKVFISEYHAPDDFKCIWQKELTNAMNTTKTYKPVEKLFTPMVL